MATGIAEIDGAGAASHAFDVEDSGAAAVTAMGISSCAFVGGEGGSTVSAAGEETSFVFDGFFAWHIIFTNSAMPIFPSMSDSSFYIIQRKLVNKLQQKYSLKG